MQELLGEGGRGGGGDGEHFAKGGCEKSERWFAQTRSGWCGLPATVLWFVGDLWWVYNV